MNHQTTAEAGRKSADHIFHSILEQAEDGLPNLPDEVLHAEVRHERSPQEIKAYMRACVVIKNYGKQVCDPDTNKQHLHGLDGVLCYDAGEMDGIKRGFKPICGYKDAPAENKKDERASITQQVKEKTIKEGGSLLLAIGKSGFVAVDVDTANPEVKKRIITFFVERWGMPFAVLPSRSFKSKKSFHMLWKTAKDMDGMRKIGKLIIGKGCRAEVFTSEWPGIYLPWANPTIIASAIQANEPTKTIDRAVFEKTIAECGVTKKESNKTASEKESTTDPIQKANAKVNQCLESIKKTKEGDRNQSLFFQTCEAFRKLKGSMPDAVFEEMFVNAGKQCGLPESETTATVRSAMANARKDVAKNSSKEKPKDTPQSTNELTEKLWEEEGECYRTHSTDYWHIFKSNQIVCKVTVGQIKKNILEKYETMFKSIEEENIQRKSEKEMIIGTAEAISTFCCRVQGRNKVSEIVNIPYRKRLITEFEDGDVPSLNISTIRLPFLNEDGTLKYPDPYAFTETEYYEWMKVALDDALPCFLEWIARAYMSAFNKTPHKTWNRYMAIVGNAGIGKTLLGAILARLFGQKQPADVTDYMLGKTKFNDEIANFFRLIDDPEESDSKSKTSLTDKIIRFTAGGTATIENKYGNKVEQSINGIFLALANQSRQHRILPATDDDSFQRVNLIKLNSDEVKEHFQMDKDFANQAFNQALPLMPAFLVNHWNNLSIESKDSRFGKIQWLDESLKIASEEEDNLPEIEDFIEEIISKAETPDQSGAGTFETFEWEHPYTKQKETFKRIALKDIRNLLTDTDGNLPEGFPRRRNGNPYTKNGLKKWMDKAVRRKKLNRWIDRQRPIIGQGYGSGAKQCNTKQDYLIWQ